MASEKPLEDWPMSPRVEAAFKAGADYDREVVRVFDPLWNTEPSPIEHEVIPDVPSTSDYH